MQRRFFLAGLGLVALGGCASSSLLPQGAGEGLRFQSVSVDVSKLAPKQLLGLPPAKQIDADLTRALTQALAGGPNPTGRAAILNVQITDFQLNDSGGQALNTNSVSQIFADAEIRDARTGEVLVPAGRVFAITPRSIADAVRMTGALLTMNPDRVKTKSKDYQDTVNNFAATLRKRVY